MKPSAINLLLASCFILTVACTSIDCPLNNVVLAKYTFYDSNGDSVKLADTLSVITTHIDGPQQDSVLFNRLTQRAKFTLPVSYNGREDEFIFHFWNSYDDVTDTVRIQKTSKPHFESVDCAPVYFHTVNEVWSTHNIIDSVVINHKTIDYDSSKENFKIYLHTGY